MLRLSLVARFFCVSNMNGVGFVNSSGKSIPVLDSTHRPVDLNYFTFCSIVSAATFDSHAPNKSLSLEF